MDEPVSRHSRFNLFPKSADDFNSEAFRNPSAEYRGCPLWSWNTELRKPLLRKEIRALQDMGIGGFTMHSRVGLDTPYLGEKFMDCVAACVSEARKLNMKAFLYDEDRWPSGAAGGLITKDDPSLRSLHLLFTPWKYGTPGHGPSGNISTGGAPFRSDTGTLLGRYAVKLNEAKLMTYRYLSENETLEDMEDGERVWYAYAESNPPSSWFNDAWYIDTLSTKAMKAFLDSTHEKFWAKAGVGSEFGKTVTAIFTDEPQFPGMSQLGDAEDVRDLFMPWTSELPGSFRRVTGLEIIPALPELFWDLANSDTSDGIHKPSIVRYKFHDHTAELFTAAFLDQLSEWCEDHSLAQMGHMMEEPTLLQQTQAIGEAMRCYRSMQIPGIDMLVDSKEYNTVKQCTSVARQYGRTGAMSEIYGVTNWTFPFKGYKGQGDWQAALGITLRSHHLSWVSMNGEGKRDYPAQIGYQSPWYKEWQFIEDHFARVNIALSRGRPRTRIAVIHPIESFWLRYGCQQTSGDQGLRDQWFADLTNWLLFGLVDFDFLSESLLPELVNGVSCPLKVGHATYDVIILPQLLTLRSTTLVILEDFISVGGRVIVAGMEPICIDARPSHRFERLECVRVNFEQKEVLNQLRAYRDLDIIDRKHQRRVQEFLYQWRSDGEHGEFLFIANTNRQETLHTTVRLRKEWSRVTVLDTLTGEEWDLKTDISSSDHTTTFDWCFEGCATLLLRLQIDVASEAPVSQDRPNWKLKNHIKTAKDISLSEDNCLMLDWCQYRIDQTPEWSTLDEILRIDNRIRDELGMHRRGDAMAQPWATPRPRPKPGHVVHLRYTFTSDIAISDAYIALEGADIITIHIDDKKLHRKDEYDYWVDESISRIPLPELHAGYHEIRLSIPFDELNTSIERIYILGSFGVSYDSTLPRGQMAWIHSRLDLSLGDITKSGLPFYTGNLTYTFPLKQYFYTGGRSEPTLDRQDDEPVGERRMTGRKKRTRMAIKIPELGVNPVVAISINGTRVGRIALPPYMFELTPYLDKSDLHHEGGDEEVLVQVTVFGNRDHAFGAIHVPDGRMQYFGPTGWRTDGDLWSDAYTIRPMGLLDGIQVLVADNHSS